MSMQGKKNIFALDPFGKSKEESEKAATEAKPVNKNTLNAEKKEGTERTPEKKEQKKESKKPAEKAPVKEVRDVKSTNSVAVMPEPVSEYKTPVAETENSPSDIQDAPKKFGRPAKPVKYLQYSCRIEEEQLTELRIKTAAHKKLYQDISAILRYAISIVLEQPADDYVSIIKKADEEGISPAKLIRKAVEEYLDK